MKEYLSAFSFISLFYTKYELKYAYNENSLSKKTFNFNKTKFLLKIC